MIGMKMLCYGWCRDVMSCLLFGCPVMIVVWVFCHDLWMLVMIGVWMLCHDWCKCYVMLFVCMLCHDLCVDVTSCFMCRCYVMISVWMFCHDWCVDVMS